jgi:DNA-binding NarL/FixJ family response regulator
VNRRLLLVEDEEGARTLLKAALTSRGLNVEAAADAGQALELAARDPRFDAVVTDVVLGKDELAGLELIPRLRDAAVTAPMVVITAFADKRRLKRAIELKVAYLLEKPFSAEQLVSVLSRLWNDPQELSHYVEQALMRARLTPKESEVARLVLKGLSNEEIASALSNSDKTVRQHLSSVYLKCGVRSRAEFFHHVFPT